MSERISFEHYLASLPSHIGYQLNDTHIAAAGFTATGRPGPVAAVTWGFNSPEALANERPDFLIEEPADFLRILNHR